MPTANNNLWKKATSGVAARLARLTKSVRFLMTASGVSFICVVNTLIGYGIWQQRQDNVTHILEHVGEQAALLRDLAEQSLRQVEQLSDGLAALLQALDGAPVSGRFNLQGYLRQYADALPQVADILVIDPKGAVRMRAKEAPSRFEAALSFSSLVDSLGDKDGRSVVNMPAFASTRQAPTAITVARRVEGMEGRVSGMLLILLDPEKLNRLFVERLTSRGAAAALVRSDGVIILSYPSERPLLHGKISEWDGLAEAVALNGQAQFLSRYGADYAFSYQRLAGSDYGVLVFRDLGVALADWRRDAMAWASIGLAMTLAIGVLTGYVVRQHLSLEADQIELLEASRRIRGILDSMLDAVVTIDGRGRINTFNRAAELLFDFAEEDIVGKPLQLLMPQHYQHYSEETKRAGNHLTEGRPYVIGEDSEILASRRDGATFPVTLSVTPLPSRDALGKNETDHFVCVVRDISKRKQYEAELMASKQAADIANRSKSEFLANMSHELRTPLNAIIGFAEVLDSEFFGALNERQKTCTRDIHDSGAHLLEIVNAILDMSKIEAGHYELHEEIIDPAEAVAHCLHMVRGRAEGTGVTLTNHIGVPLPNILVDRRSYRQALLNLLSNAVKFTPSGGHVSVDAEIRDGALAVRVSDTGVGIPDSFKPFLYQPFRQADHSASRQFEGVGLGLSIAKNLMQLHGGTLNCDSREGHGTTFTAVIPASRIVLSPNELHFKAATSST